MLDRIHRLATVSCTSLAAFCLSHSAAAQSVVSQSLSEQDWSSIESAHIEALHEVVPDGSNYTCTNPRQNWTIHFDDRGFSVVPDSSDWNWGLDLVGYGFEGNRTDPRISNCIAAKGDRVRHFWDDNLEEWYINDTRGLEHGFTLQRRPKTNDGIDSGLLSLVLRVRGDLKTEVEETGRDVSFHTADGSIALTYSNLTVFDATGQEFPAWFEHDDEALTIFVDEQNALYPLTIDPLAEQQLLKASNAEAVDWFGAVTAISGNTIVVGAYREDSNATGVNGAELNNGSQDSGAVYVFTRNGSTWTQQAYLKASNTDAGDNFGKSVGISGDTIVVGADFERSGSSGINGNELDNSVASAGAAYVFVRTGTTWSQEAYLKSSTPSQINLFGDGFGASVAVDGDTVAVGATSEDSAVTGVNGNEENHSATAAGAVYVFTRSGTTWIQEAYIKASNTEAFDSFGRAVSLSGNTLVVSTTEEDSNASGINGDQANNLASASGAVYVYTRSGTSWSQQAYIKASNTEADDEFGRDVAVDADTLAVGASSEDSDAMGINGSQGNGVFTSSSGAAYIFVRTGTTWSQQAYVKPSNTDGFDNFGSAVAISGDNLVVGAANEDSNAVGLYGDDSNDSSANSGAAYLFTRVGSTWTQDAYFKASNAASGSRFGAPIAISGDTFVVGAFQEDTTAADSGAAYAFQIIDSLVVDVPSISISVGGTQTFSLDGTPARANWFYAIFGSFTGTSPGIDLLGVFFPINFDDYFKITLRQSQSSAFGNFRGSLDGNGQATATITASPGLDPTLAGLTLNHAFVAAETLGDITFASNAVSLMLVP